MPLTEIETRVLKTCCDLNDKITLNVRENDRLFVYKSRFLEVDFQKGFVVIDEPSAETPNAKPLSKGQYFEVFFEYKIFRYLFYSKVLEHTKYNMGDRQFYGLKIFIPQKLEDGDKREYFRVQTVMRPPVAVKFSIYPKGSEKPIMEPIKSVNTLTEDSERPPKIFNAEIIDISGGGMAIRGKPGEKSLPLEKGDVINAKFKLKKELEVMEIWSEVRNVRKYQNTQILVWGVQFYGKEKNRAINFYRNKILRYVTERQREIIAK